MKNLLALPVVLCSMLSISPANAAEARFFEVWQCTLKEGASMEQVMAANAKWLRFVTQAFPDAGITSGTVTAVVGDYTRFSIIDSYPDMQAWVETKQALKTEAGEAAGSDLDLALECSGNSLQNYTPSE